MDLFTFTMGASAFGGDAEPSGVQHAMTAPPAAPVLADQAIGAALSRHGHAWKEEAGPRYAIGAGGGTSQVWTAADCTLMRQVAIKSLAPGRADPDHIAAFVAEARLTASLQHPHVPPVHDLVVGESGQPCFIMKAVEGMTLGAALRHATAGETPAVISTINGVVNAFIAIGQALSYAHHQGVIHQDVKPDNILLGRFGEVLLLDWGCARRRDDPAAPLFGTPYYMSPEQARRERSDERSDVYCVGASLFHALIRRPPLASRPTATFWDLKRRGVIDQPIQAERARVPQPLLAIVLKALAADPAKRYQDMDALLAELNAYQAGLAVAAHRDSLWHAMRRWGFRHRAALVAGLVVLASAVAAGGAILHERARERAQWLPVAGDDFSGGNVAAATNWTIKQADTWSREPFTEIGLGGELGNVVDGRLEIGHFGKIVNAVWKTGLAGDLRVEWTCTPLVNGLNLNCFIGPDRRTGITLQVGTWGDARCAAIFRNDQEMIDHSYLEQTAVVGRPHAFVLERENGLIRLAYDGQWILQADEVEAGDAMAPITIGFDAYNESRLAIDAVKIYARPLPERISPLAVGGRLFSLGLYPEARRQFQELARLRATEAVGIEASYHAAVCLNRLGDPAADAELAGFIAAHPQHHLVSRAIFERYVLAEKAGRREAIDARCRDMAGSQDQRLRQRVVARLGTELEGEVKKRSQESYGSAEGREEYVTYLLGEARRIHELARILNVRLRRHDLLERITEELRSAGRSRVALDICPGDAPERIKCMVDLARLDEALAASENFLNEQALVQEAMGRFADMTRSQRLRPKLEGWFRLGDQAALAAADPWGEYLGDTLIDLGQAEAVAGEPRWPSFVRARALARLGRWAEIIDGGGGGNSQVVEALCRLGRGEEALKRFHWDASSLGLMAAYRLLQGDQAGCRALVERLEAMPPNYARRSTLFGHCLMPVILRARLGDADPVRSLSQLTDWQREVLSGRLAVMASYISGSIDEAACRRQLVPLCSDSLVQIANAVRADIAGDQARARALWREILATPSSRLLEEDMLSPMASLLGDEATP